MDFSALLVGIEITRREANSALPHAPVRPPGTRWRRTRAAVHRVTAPGDRSAR